MVRLVPHLFEFSSGEAVLTKQFGNLVMTVLLTVSIVIHCCPTVSRRQNDHCFSFESYCDSLHMYGHTIPL